MGTGSLGVFGSSFPRAEKRVSFPTFSPAITLGCQTALLVYLRVPASVSGVSATLARDQSLPQSAEGSALTLVKRRTIGQRRETDYFLDSSPAQPTFEFPRLQR